jgi:hypothetical protein
MVTSLVEHFSPSHISPYHISPSHTFIATVYKKVKFKNIDWRLFLHLVLVMEYGKIP